MSDCNLVIPDELFESCLRNESYNKYRTFMSRSFVEDNPKVR